MHAPRPHLLLLPFLGGSKPVWTPLLARAKESLGECSWLPRRLCVRCTQPLSRYHFHLVSPSPTSPRQWKHKVAFRAPLIKPQSCVHQITRQQSSVSSDIPNWPLNEPRLVVFGLSNHIEELTTFPCPTCSVLERTVSLRGGWCPPQARPWRRAVIDNWLAISKCPL